MISKDEIRGWFEAAKELGSTHMIVVCDTFDHEDYPVGVYSPIKGDEECLKQYDAHQNVNMQHVMEVYDISKGWVAQSQRRPLVMNLPDRVKSVEHRAKHSKRSECICGDPRCAGVMS